MKDMIGCILTSGEGAEKVKLYCAANDMTIIHWCAWSELEFDLRRIRCDGAVVAAAPNVNAYYRLKQRTPKELHLIDGKNATLEEYVNYCAEMRVGGSAGRPAYGSKNEEEAKIRDEILALHAAGLSHWEIVKQLRAEGKKSRNGKNFSVSTVQSVCNRQARSKI